MAYVALKHCSLRHAVLKQINNLAGKQIGEDVVDGSEIPVCSRASGERIIFSGVVQHVHFGL